MNVLIVDDDAAIVRMVERILSKEGHQVSSESNGRSALARAHALRPDLILLDIMMPGIDGLAVLAEIRRTPALEHTRIVMLTARSQGLDKFTSLKTGADAYIIKPFTVEQLLHGISHVSSLPPAGAAKPGS
jgi:DNA-binding response OmpR family regulator